MAQPAPVHTFTPPSAADQAIHARCIVRTFTLLSGAGRDLVVRVVNAATAAEADRCWSTPHAPEGTPTDAPAQYYRADLLIAAIAESGERWVKGGNFVDLFTKFAPVLQDAYTEGDGEDPPALQWEESPHIFADKNLVHWMIARPDNLDLDDLVSLVLEEAATILSKAPKALRTDRDK